MPTTIVEHFPDELPFATVCTHFGNVLQITIRDTRYNNTYTHKILHIMSPCRYILYCTLQEIRAYTNERLESLDKHGDYNVIATYGDNTIGR